MLQDRLADKHDELTTCARQGHIEAPRIQDKRLFARHKVAVGDHIAGDHEVPFLPLEAVHRIDERGWVHRHPGHVHQKIADGRHLRPMRCNNAQRIGPKRLVIRTMALAVQQAAVEVGQGCH